MNQELKFVKKSGSDGGEDMKEQTRSGADERGVLDVKAAYSSRGRKT